MFEKKTKWIILTAYNSDGNDYVVFVRKGLKSGMLYFKCKKATPFGSLPYFFKKDIGLEVKEQFNKIINQ